MQREGVKKKRTKKTRSHFPIPRLHAPLTTPNFPPHALFTIPRSTVFPQPYTLSSPFNAHTPLPVQIVCKSFSAPFPLLKVAFLLFNAPLLCFQTTKCISSQRTRLRIQFSTQMISTSCNARLFLLPASYVPHL